MCFDITYWESKRRTFEGKVYDSGSILRGRAPPASPPTPPQSPSWQEQASSKASIKCALLLSLYENKKALRSAEASPQARGAQRHGLAPAVEHKGLQVG